MAQRAEILASELNRAEIHGLPKGQVAGFHGLKPGMMVLLGEQPGAVATSEGITDRRQIITDRPAVQQKHPEKSVQRSSQSTSRNVTSAELLDMSDDKMTASILSPGYAHDLYTVCLNVTGNNGELANFRQFLQFTKAIEDKNKQENAMLATALPAGSPIFALPEAIVFETKEQGSDTESTPVEESPEPEPEPEPMMTYRSIHDYLAQQAVVNKKGGELDQTSKKFLDPKPSPFDQLKQAISRFRPLQTREQKLTGAGLAIAGVLLLSAQASHQETDGKTVVGSAYSATHIPTAVTVPTVSAPDQLSVATPVVDTFGQPTSYGVPDSSRICPTAQPCRNVPREDVPQIYTMASETVRSIELFATKTTLLSPRIYSLNSASGF